MTLLTSTHSMVFHSSSAKSLMPTALSAHGFHTTVLSEPSLPITSSRPSAGSATRTSPRWANTASVSP